MALRALRFLTLASLVAALLPGAARADITSTPRRLVFTPEGPREQALTIVNNGKAPATYRIGFIHYVQVPGQGLVEVTRPADAPQIRWADKLLRVSPKSVVLPPGQAQTVRVQVQAAANLPAGEYRTHVLLTEVPKPKPPPSLSRPQGERRARVSITTVYRLALPILVWRGAPQAEVGLKDLKFSPGRDGNGKLDFTVVRSGDRSVFGFVKAAFLPYRESESIDVGQFLELSVYHPNREFTYHATVNLPPEHRGKRGRLILTYYDPAATPQIRDEQSIEIY